MKFEAVKTQGCCNIPLLVHRLRRAFNVFDPRDFDTLQDKRELGAYAVKEFCLPNRTIYVRVMPPRSKRATFCEAENNLSGH